LWCLKLIKRYMFFFPGKLGLGFRFKPYFLNLVIPLCFYSYWKNIFCR
jgi:hypothetical protein